MIVENIKDVNFPDRLKDSVAVLKIDSGIPDWEIGLHQHEYGQLMATISGLITVSTEKGIWVVPPKTAIWIPANTPHSPTGVGISTCHVVFILQNIFYSNDCQIIQVSDFLSALLKRAELIHPNYAINSTDAHLMQVLVDEIINAPQQWLYLPLPKDKRLKIISNALLHQPYLKTSLAEWASICCISERSLTRVFKEETKLSLNNWRRRLHIILALQLLNDGHSISYIANELGYVSDSSFITMFKKTMKYSPKKFYIECMNEENKG
ncbi:AraC family transcriptional regulator [Acinetobacter sp. ANC 4648]|uniref:AraC family transcriptional regulator n=1 Tax=Acinetobacter sp. ANC 4648 TaxID=1977875 RepID=UPI000A34A7B1|nr:helix-turn-helix transcriptional regulator [Acinetobacter sp. ANC 4648]OTG80274.1 AraC family transcriptional regulator [Acinetobacter sp. ANC 4648]